MQTYLTKEKHIAEIAKELEIKLEVISTGKISEFENYIQHSDIHQLYFLDNVTEFFNLLNPTVISKKGTSTLSFTIF